MKKRLSKVAKRKEPLQSRSKDTFEKILNVTEELLDEIGLDRLTTVLIAGKARMSVGTVYEYFPNKHAILFALASRWVEKMKQVMAANDVRSSEFVTWQEWCEGYIRSMVTLYSQEKGLVKYYDMLVSVLELRELDLELDEVVVAYLSRSLLSFFPSLKTDDLEILNRMIITNMHNVLRFAVNMTDPQKQKMLNNLHFVIQTLILKNAY
jgi:AcrR family transcriptional regulator